MLHLHRAAGQWPVLHVVMHQTDVAAGEMEAHELASLGLKLPEGCGSAAGVLAAGVLDLSGFG